MLSLLPPNATAIERAIEAVVAGSLDLIQTPLRAIWDAADCPLAILPYLASGLSVEGWKSEWSEAKKRDKVANALAFHRRKGTPDAVREVLADYGVGLTLTEGFEVGAPAYTFVVNLPLEGIGGDVTSGEFIDQVATEVTRTKPVRAHMIISQSLGLDGDVGLTGAGRAAIYARLPIAAEVADRAADWVGVLLTNEGEPIFTDAGDRLELVA